MIRFCTFNARGLGDFVKRKKLYTLLKHKKIDVAFIQETHAKENEMNLWQSQWGGNIAYANGTSSSKGVLILTGRDSQVKLGPSIVDLNGRFIIVEVEINDIKILLCNVYAPNVDTPNFFVEIATKLEKFENSNIIWGGDFNFVIDNSLDRKFSFHNNDRARDVFLAYAEDKELCDVWRVLNPDKKQYSCLRPNSNLDEWQKFSRLDMFFVSAGLMNGVSRSVMETGFQSDHSFVIFDLKVSSEVRGPGYWKFNSSNLYDKNFVTAGNAILEESIHKCSLSPDLKWEFVKGAFIQYSKAYGRDRARDKEKKLKDINDKLDTLRTLTEELPMPEEEAKQEFIAVVKEREHFLQEKVRGMIVRSREKFYEEGERSSKYYFSLEKHRASKKVMHRIREHDGSIVSDSKQILQHQHSFYRKLYKANQDIMFRLDNSMGAKISADERKNLEQDITLVELTNAVRSMQNNKSPGLDGLTIEVYKVFWQIIGPVLHQAIICSKRSGKLQLSLRRGLISLIPKKNRDHLEIGNWRPITLLANDYKILSKALALRLQVLLPNIISEDQTGFMKGRSITDNIRKTIDVVNYAYQTKQEIIIMSIDYQKCFDFLEHTAIWGSLKYFNFGDKFIEWIKLLYNEITLSTINNGNISESFEVQRSVLQGSPLGAFLFLLVGQILHDKLTSDSNIKGVNIRDVEFLIAQFADDTTLFLQFDRLTLDSVIRALDTLYQNTGLVTNYDKTTIYRVGSIVNSNAKIYTTKEFAWSNDPIQMLGTVITTSPEIDKTSENNYVAIVEKASNVMKQWECRRTTLMGKVLLVNTLIASLFVYLMQVLPNMTQGLVKQLNDRISSFIWSGRKPKIAREVLICDKKQGGLRLVDIEARQRALKMQWVIRIKNDGIWSTLFNGMLKENLGNLIWVCNLHSKHVKYIFREGTDLFWVQIAEAWASCNFKNQTEKLNVGEQVIWYNSNILVQNRPMLFINAFNAGIMYIQDLIQNDGSFKDFEQIGAEFGDCMNWLQYRQICEAIPMSWKNMLTHNDNNYVVNLYDRIKNETKITRIVYNLLIDKDNVMMYRMNRWERKLGISIQMEYFLKYFQNIYKQTIATKYRDFQYRLIAGALVTNHKLWLWKIIDDESCSFCGNHIEDEVHLFFDCSKIRVLWEDLKEFLRSNVHTNITDGLKWGLKETIFSVVHSKPTHVINFIVTIAKRYIYVCRCFKCTPNINCLIREIDDIYNIEYNIAKRKSKVSRHFQKWADFKEIDDSEGDYIAEYLNNL